MTFGRRGPATESRETGDSGFAMALADVVADGTIALDEGSIRNIELGLIDALGCIVAGSREPVACRARQAVCTADNGPGRMVIGTDLRVRPAEAAFLNATAGHALEFDDWEIPGNTHPSIVLVPAILAVADGPLCGTRLAAAYARGFEAIARVGEAVNFEHYGRGWHTTGTLGAIGAAAAASATLGLDRVRAAHAISLACSRSSGLTGQFGSDAKALQAGFAAEAGVVAALLAAEGLTGRLDVFESPTGFAATMGGTAADRFERPQSKLAAPWAIDEYGLVLKAYPTCGYTHRTVDAVLELRPQLVEAALDPEHISSIRIRLPELHADVVPFMRPTSMVEARFSLPFAVAVALLDGGIGLDDLRSGRWNDPATAALMARCRVEPFAPRRSELNYDPEDPDHVTIESIGGRRFEARVAFPFGSPQRPMNREDVLDKATSLIRATDRARAALSTWIGHEDMQELIAGLDPGSAGQETP